MNQLNNQSEIETDEYRYNFMCSICTQFVTSLEQQGFTFEEVLDGLANHAFTNNEGVDTAFLLAQASLIVSKTYKRKMKNISIPHNWTPPKYHFGQRVKQGQIVGLEYFIPGTLRAYELGEGWNYLVCRDEMSDSIENVGENRIQPLSPTEIKKEIQGEIDFYQSKVAALTEQLEAEQWT